MGKPLAIAAAIGAVLYPLLLLVLSVITGNWQPLWAYLLFIPGGAIAGMWVMLIWP